MFMMGLYNFLLAKFTSDNTSYQIVRIRVYSNVVSCCSIEIIQSLISSTDVLRPVSTTAS
jgi:NADH:ubiquinone oxidoreductase subunit B-like Fe-S oxidoreductase